MKIKIKQSIAVIEDGKTQVPQVGQEIEVKDATGKGMIQAGYAEEVVEPKKETAKPKAKPKAPAKAKTEEAGE